MLTHVFPASQFCSFVMASKFSRGIFRIHLNGDQREIVKFAAKGHNLLITGQAGVGKSEVVKRIIATSRGDPGIILVWLSTNRFCLPPSG